MRQFPKDQMRQSRRVGLLNALLRHRQARNPNVRTAVNVDLATWRAMRTTQGEEAYARLGPY
jgi:hypothetical protein